MGRAPTMTPKQAHRRVTDNIRDGRDVTLTDLMLIQTEYPKKYRDGMTYYTNRNGATGTNGAQSLVGPLRDTTATQQGTTAAAPSPDNAKKRKLDISQPSKSLLSRHQPLNKEDDEGDVGGEVGDHLIPIGTLRNDPGMKRTIWASFDIDGFMDIKALPYNGLFQKFVTSPEHERYMKTDVTVVDDWTWFTENVDLIDGFKHDEISVREYVFRRMGETVEGRRRISSWAIEEETRTAATAKNPRKLSRAWAEKEMPGNVDLLKHEERELTVGQRLATLISLAQNERRLEKRLDNAYDRMKEVMETTKNPYDRQETATIKITMDNLQAEIVRMRASRDIHFMMNRATVPQFNFASWTMNDDIRNRLSKA